MPKLLNVLASPRGDYSISRALSAKFVDEWQKKHGGDVVTRDLYTTELPFVDLPWIMGAYTPVEQHSPEVKKAIAISDKLIGEIQAADHILIATPMYNFSTPAILKAWIDHIVRVNVTFSPSYEGLLKNKKVNVIISSGSDYAAGSPMASYNKESDYLKAVLGFIGLTDVTIELAGGTGGVDQGKISREDLLAKYTPAVTEMAAK